MQSPGIPVLMSNSHRFVSFITAAFAVATAPGQGGSFGVRNPFSAPGATTHYAPDRMYDLVNLTLDMDLDYPNRLLTATATNSIAAIRDGVTQLRFHANPAIKIESVQISGQTAAYTRDVEGILVTCAPTKTGDKMDVVIHYHLKKSETPNGNGVNGWHWHEPRKSDPSKVGVWTNGEPDETRDWAVTWDYPNDFTTSETRTTVPAEWEVISNGLLVSDKVNAGGKTRTVDWKMTQGHATYLTSIVAGPFDIKHDKWRGMPLYYVAPKGMGAKLDDTVVHTKDMLSYYSDSLGVRFPWPKYAEDFVYDFGGGQENVSATTFGLFFADPRQGWYDSDSLLSHEMGHQWFGDFVTCKDWGQIWLNESFATWMEMTYTKHSRGDSAAMREIEQYSREYLQESRRYKRPLATTFYANPGVMFDQHTYPKGGVLLTSLEKLIGEKAFLRGLHNYLTLHGNSPVETSMLCDALTDASGFNLRPWFDQWIYKPGHPVIDWSWSYDADRKEVVVKVKQTQDTSAGTPVYDLMTHIGVIADGRLERKEAHLKAASEEFHYHFDSKPDSVVFDPDHEFLREITKSPWTDQELPFIAQFDPNPVERQTAFTRMLGDNPSDAVVRVAVDILKSDKGFEPAIESTGPLQRLSRPELRSLWESELTHENFQRRATALTALASMPPDAQDFKLLRGLVDDMQPYAVVSGAIHAVAKFDYEGSKSVIEQQAKTSSVLQIRRAALEELLSHNDAKAADLMFDSMKEDQPSGARQAGIATLASFKGDDPRIVPALRSMLKSEDNFGGVFQAIEIIQTRKLKEMIPDLQDLKKRIRFGQQQIDNAIETLQKA